MEDDRDLRWLGIFLGGLLAVITAISGSITAAADDGWEYYEHPDLGIALEVPSNWVIQPDPGRDFGFRISSPGISADPLGRPQAGAALGGTLLKAAGRTLEEYLDAAYWSAVFSSQQEVTVSDAPGYRIAGVHGDGTAFAALLWQQGDQFYDFALLARHSDWRLYEAQAARMLDSITAASAPSAVSMMPAAEAAPPVFDFPPLKHAFPAGVGRISSGYDTWSHRGGDDFALDLCGGANCWRGAPGDPVLAATEMKLVWSGNGYGMPEDAEDFHMFEIAANESSKLCMSLGHLYLRLDGLVRGSWVPQGAVIGTLAGAPISSPHVHTGIWSVPLNALCAGYNRSAIPYTGAFALDGVEYPVGVNHSGKAILSTNQPVCARPTPGSRFSGRAVGVADAAACLGPGLDDQPPQGRWMAPLEHSLADARQLTLSVEAADAGIGIQSVELLARWDAEWVTLAVLGQAPYTFAWDLCSAAVPDGALELDFLLSDLAGNRWLWSQENPPLMVSKDFECAPASPPEDLSPPLGRITYPTDGAVISQRPLSISVEALDDASGVEVVSFFAEDCLSECRWVLIGEDRDFPFLLEWDWATINQASTRLKIEIGDRASKTTEAAGGILRLSFDQDRPTAAFSAPPAGYLTGGSTTLQVSAEDAGSNITGVKFYAGYQDGGSYWHPLGWDREPSDGWGMTWDFSAIPDQDGVALYAYAVDAGGNSTALVNWDLALDQTAPQSNVLALPETSAAEFEVRWQGSDPGSDLAGFEIQVRRDQGAWTSWQGSTLATRAQFNGIPGSRYEFRSRARDRAGNQEPWPASADALTTIEAMAIGEVGSISPGLTDQPLTVFFARTYRQPLVFAGPLPVAEAEHASIRILSVEADRFTVMIDEPSNQDQSHALESLSYLVIEGGDWQLADGRRIAAGEVLHSSRGGRIAAAGWKQIQFGSRFAAAPVVISQLQSRSSPAYTITRTQDISPAGFKLALQGEEADRHAHPAEGVAWLAIEAGSGLWSGLGFEALTSAPLLTEDWISLNFQQTYAGVPHLFAAIASYTGSNPIVLRQRGLSSSQVQLSGQEETSADVEIQHSPEALSYLVLGASGGLNALPFEPRCYLLTLDHQGAGSAPRAEPAQSSGCSAGRYVAGEPIELLPQPDPGFEVGSWEGTAAAHQARLAMPAAAHRVTATYQQRPPGLIGEVGQIDQVLTHLPHQVLLQGRYHNPVVFAAPLTQRGGDPVVVRILQVQPDRFSLYLEEPPYLNGLHPPESVSYLVLEAGSWRLPDGARLEVGRIETSAAAGKLLPNRWAPILFDPAFETPPVVLSALQSTREPGYLGTRLQNVRSAGINLALEPYEAQSRAPASEIIGWLAIQSGAGQWGDLHYQALASETRVGDAWREVGFETTFAALPRLLASIQTYNGGDSSTLRYQGLSTSGVQLRVQEERSLDRETRHAFETIGLLLFGGEGMLPAVGR